LFWPNIGGAEVFASHLLMAMRERGREVILVTRRDSDDLPSEDRYQGIPIDTIQAHAAPLLVTLIEERISGWTWRAGSNAALVRLSDRKIVGRAGDGAPHGSRDHDPLIPNL
jgi:hypothetical protein